MTKSDGTGWNVFGWIMICTGLLTAFLGLSYETSVETPYISGIAGLEQTQSVQNFGLMLNKLLLISAGMVATVIGFICLATGALLRQSYMPAENEEIEQETL